MPTVVVKNGDFFMKVVANAATFIDDRTRANTYTSKYAAKRHLRMLDNVPETIKITELQSVED